MTKDSALTISILIILGNQIYNTRVELNVSKYQSYENSIICPSYCELHQLEFLFSQLPFYRIKLAGVVPVFLDLKGNYGVAINWSDGHYADIFPFDILREIGENFQSK